MTDSTDEAMRRAREKRREGWPLQMTGVPASPSGYSASPEPVVSALRASIPNAGRA
jgi:hypothetical protein